MKTSNGSDVASMSAGRVMPWLVMRSRRLVGDGLGLEPGEDGADGAVEVEEQVPGRGDDLAEAAVLGAGHPAGS